MVEESKQEMVEESKKPKAAKKTTKKATNASKNGDYTYEYVRYVAMNKDDIKAKLSQYGVAIVPNLLNYDECDEMENGMWDFFEHITARWDRPISRDDEESWSGFTNLLPVQSMIYQHHGVGQAQVSWDLRQNEKVASVHAELLKCNVSDMIVSMDGLSFLPPPEITGKGWAGKNINSKKLHVNQSYLRNGLENVQSWVTATEICEGDATLSFLEGSHLLHEKASEEFGAKKSIEKKDEDEEKDSAEGSPKAAEGSKSKKNIWKEHTHKLTDEELKFYTEVNDCAKKKVTCPRGSMVLWDSRLVHGDAAPTKGRASSNLRAVIYVSYALKSSASASVLKKRQTAYDNGRTTRHNPTKSYWYPMEPSYGKQVNAVQALPKAELTKLGERLLGME